MVSYKYSLVIGIDLLHPVVAKDILWHELRRSNPSSIQQLLRPADLNALPPGHDLETMDEISGAVGPGGLEWWRPQVQMTNPNKVYDGEERKAGIGLRTARSYPVPLLSRGDGWLVAWMGYCDVRNITSPNCYLFQ